LDTFWTDLVNTWHENLTKVNISIVLSPYFDTIVYDFLFLI
jgi:hypothetical protein